MNTSFEHTIALASYKPLISDKNGFLQELNEINRLRKNTALEAA